MKEALLYYCLSKVAGKIRTALYGDICSDHNLHPTIYKPCLADIAAIDGVYSTDIRCLLG